MNGLKIVLVGVMAAAGFAGAVTAASAKDARHERREAAYGYADRDDYNRQHYASDGYGSAWYYFSGKIDKKIRQGPGDYYRGLWR